MPDVVKHAWTHRPRAQGGTDPIEIPTGTGPISATAASPLTTYTHAGLTRVDFTTLYRTAGSGYAPQGGDPTDFQFINLPEDGFYLADFVVFWDEGDEFDPSDNPHIVATCHFAGTPDQLVASVGAEAWDNEQGWIGGEQISADELNHNALVSRFWFNYTAVDFDPSFGIGVSLLSGVGSRSMDIGGKVAVTRLGDALEEAT
jgi:hypothetical protein